MVEGTSSSSIFPSRRIMAGWTILPLLLAFVVVSASSVEQQQVVDNTSAKTSEPALVDDNKASADDQSCLADADGTCQAPNASAATASTTTTANSPSECGLYLAASSIPFAGWGMYTGFSVKEDAVIPPVDVVIPVIDIEAHRTLLHHYQQLELTKGYGVMPHLIQQQQGRLHRHTPPNATAVKKQPKWLMHQYYWDCSMTHNYYDAEHIDSVVPGLGMLANSHPGMVLAENIGPARPVVLGGRGFPARTPYQDQSFVALADIPAGHEIFVEYGDDWFEERFDETFGLSADYSNGNKLAEKWQTFALDQFYQSHNGGDDDDDDDTSSNNMLQDLADLLLDMIEPFNPRLHAVLGRLNLLPKDDDNRDRLVAKNNPTAYASVPDAPRTLEWLQSEGLCLDHITVRNSTVAPGERGAFASRLLPKGTVVAPAPVVHMSRDHLTMLMMDEYDSDIVLWKGYQLLLNYVYGHIESSLLFFPYAPSVNLINHYGGKVDNNNNRRPNVKLQWSSKMPNPEWLESWTPEPIVEQSERAGMVMEIVALEDIPAGAEILLDYGNAWQSAFEEHAATTPPAPDYPEVNWEAQELLTVNDDEQYPGFVQTVCWIHDDQRPLAVHEKAREDGSGRVPDKWMTWKSIPTQYLSDTMPCTIVGRQADGALYNVILSEPIDDMDTDRGNNNRQEAEVETKITNLPRRAVTIVPMLYTDAVHRRDAFRHEIQLPDEMVPEHWRDLRYVEVTAPEQCDLYMAESAIPNAGWGLYRGYGTTLDPEGTTELDKFCQDMVIQVEDFTMNQELRRRFFDQEPDPEMDEWVLSRYAWGGAVVKGGNFEAQEVQSYAPGCGMLANSHPLLYNTHVLPPLRKPVNTTDPSLGATTHYHNVLFVEQYLKLKNKKVRTMQNGIEVLVKYGDAYFKERQDVIGQVPLKADYVVVDRVLKHFLEVKKKHGQKAAGLVWKLLWNTVEVFDLERIAAALPKNMDEAEKAIDQGGSARYLLPDRERTPKWLEQHGACADNIRPGDSAVELAGGKGAFATRKMAKGKVIAPLPMLHLHRDHLDIYNSDDIYDPEVEVFLEGKQLLLNYCYGHPESSLLLFPYSPTVNYINHAPSGTANARLQWSSKFNMKEWLRKSPVELLRNHKHAGLAMEVVATREIAPGEEIFLDYGFHWENAWRNHTENWKLHEEWDYEPPNNLWLDWVPTEEEITDRGLYFQNERADKFLGCHVRPPAGLATAVRNEEREDGLPEFEWKKFDSMFRTTRHVYSCEIIERIVESDDFLYATIRQESVSPLPDYYTAMVTVESDDGETPPQRFISYDMPRRAIEIFDEEYRGPQFNREAFRHEIGILDEMVPEHWRDLKKF